MVVESGSDAHQGRETGDRNAVFARLEREAQERIGHRLFTIMAFHPDSMEVERLYSSDPVAYPPGGRKRKRDTAWGRKVLERGEPFIGRTADDIRANFNDHELILSLGLESVLNIPIFSGGRVVGTMNLLHGPDYYGRSHLEAGGVLARQLSSALAVDADSR